MKLTLGLLSRRTAPAVVAVPLSISFYTFHAIGCLVVTAGRWRLTEPGARRATSPCSRTSSPARILRAGASFLLPAPRHRRLGAGRGAELVAWGYHFLKLGLADSLAPWSSAASPTRPPSGALDHLTGTALFALQIYGDFAGYSLIAIGLGRIPRPLDFGINFRRPCSPRAWPTSGTAGTSACRPGCGLPLHPAGRLPHGAVRTACSLMLTMLLGGLWHGPRTTWLAWGFWHGVLLVAERPLPPGRPRRLARPGGPRRLFVPAGIGWILFRSASLADAALILGRIAGLALPRASPASSRCTSGAASSQPASMLAVDLAVEQGRLAARYRDRRPAASPASPCCSWLILLGRLVVATEFFYFRFWRHPLLVAAVALLLVLGGDRLLAATLRLRRGQPAGPCPPLHRPAGTAQVLFVGSSRSRASISRPAPSPGRPAAAASTRLGRPVQRAGRGHPARLHRPLRRPEIVVLEVTSPRSTS